MSGQPFVVVKKLKRQRTLLADWDGTTSGWLDLGTEETIIALKFTGLDTAPALTFEVAEDINGANAAPVLNDAGTTLSITDPGGALYRFFPELGSARFVEVTADQTQTDARIVGYFAT